MCKHPGLTCTARNCPLKAQLAFSSRKAFTYNVCRPEAGINSLPCYDGHALARAQPSGGKLSERLPLVDCISASSISHCAQTCMKEDSAWVYWDYASAMVKGHHVHSHDGRERLSCFQPLPYRPSGASGGRIGRKVGCTCHMVFKLRQARAVECTGALAAQNGKELKEVMELEGGLWRLRWVSLTVFSLVYSADRSRGRHPTCACLQPSDSLHAPAHVVVPHPPPRGRSLIHRHVGVLEDVLASVTSWMLRMRPPSGLPCMHMPLQCCCTACPATWLYRMHCHMCVPRALTTWMYGIGT